MAVRIQESWPHLQYVAWGCLVLNIQLFYAKEAIMKLLQQLQHCMRSVVPEYDTQ